MMNPDAPAEVKKVEAAVDPVQGNKSKEQVRYIWTKRVLSVLQNVTNVADISIGCNKITLLF